MTILNRSLWAAKLRGRATLVLEHNARLSSGARIVNMRASNDAISVGENSLIQGELLTFPHGGRIRIGSMCFVGPGSRIWSAGAIELGDYVLVSHNVDIMDNLTHPLDRLERRRHAEAILTHGHPRQIDLGEKAVTIEDDVWIGAGATILRGVHIGRGAIIGARSVVTTDVPAMATVAGNPARVIRQSDDQAGQDRYCLDAERK